MKLIKIQFTKWRDKPSEPRSWTFQRQLDDWHSRISVLTAAIADMKEKQAIIPSEALQKTLDTAVTDLETIDGERTTLLAVEKRAADGVMREARNHKRVGTFGYQIFNDASTLVKALVDEAGNGLLPEKAVYSFEIVDHHPPLPAWAK